MNLSLGLEGTLQALWQIGGGVSLESLYRVSGLTQPVTAGQVHLSRRLIDSLAMRVNVFVSLFLYTRLSCLSKVD